MCECCHHIICGTSGEVFASKCYHYEIKYPYTLQVWEDYIKYMYKMCSSVVINTEIFYVVNTFKYLVEIHATQLTVNQLKQLILS